jgi:3-oxoacyl-[acyl-carrier-protein] synthase II
MDNVKRVVITGLGPVTAIGVGKEAFWKNLLLGSSNYGSITRFPLNEWDKIRIAAEINGFDPEKYVPREVLRAVDKIAPGEGRTLFYALAGTKLAIEDAELDLSTLDMEKVGVIVGSGVGDLGIIKYGQAGFVRGALHLGNSLPGLIAKEIGSKGTTRFVSAACATGNVTLEEGLVKIRYGGHEIMIVGASDSPIRTSFFIGTEEDRRFGQKGLSTKNDLERGMIPFGIERDGFVLSEGAGILILESLEHAQSRGARIYAEVLGCGNYTSFDENLVRVTDEGYQGAMRNTLVSANVDNNDEVYVNAHGTATQMNDHVESNAIAKVFGKAVPVSSFKGTLGHAQTASPAIELIGCALALRNNSIPVSNLRELGPECAVLDYVREVRDCPGLILKNAAGFNGVYSSVVLRRFY